MSIRNSAALAIASMALGLSIGTALSTGASRTPASPSITVVPTPVVIAPGSQPVAYPPTNPVVVPTTPPSSLEGLHPANAGKPVAVGTAALARWHDGTWWEATITAVGQGTVTAQWADGSPADQLPLGHVAALPTRYDSVEVGDYALCSWQSSTQWWRARIVDRYGTPTIEYIDGDSAVLGVERCVPADFPED